MIQFSIKISDAYFTHSTVTYVEMSECGGEVAETPFIILQWNIQICIK